MKSILLASVATAAAMAFANDGTKPRVEPVFKPAAAIALPKRESKRGSDSKYPFATLEVGTAFGVDNKEARQLSAIISAFNRKCREPILDSAGNPTFEVKRLTDGAGLVTEVPDTTKPKTRATKHFYAVDVDKDIAKLIKGTTLEGSKSLVYRDA